VFLFICTFSEFDDYAEIVDDDYADPMAGG